MPPASITLAACAPAKKPRRVTPMERGSGMEDWIRLACSTKGNIIPQAKAMPRIRQPALSNSDSGVETA